MGKIAYIEDNEGDYVLVKDELANDFSISHYLSYHDYLESNDNYSVVILDLNTGDNDKYGDRVKAIKKEVGALKLAFTGIIPYGKNKDHLMSQGIFAFYNKNTDLINLIDVIKGYLS